VEELSGKPLMNRIPFHTTEFSLYNRAKHVIEGKLLPFHFIMPFLLKTFLGVANNKRQAGAVYVCVCVYAWLLESEKPFQFFRKWRKNDDN